MNSKELRDRVQVGDQAAIAEMERRDREAGEYVRSHPRTAQDWEEIGEALDKVHGNSPGTYLARVAERLNEGLPVSMTDIELKARIADVQAKVRIKNGQGSSLTPEEIAQRAIQVDKQ